MKGGIYILNQISMPIHVIIVQDIYRTVYCSNLRQGQAFHYEHHNCGRFYVIVSDGKPISAKQVKEFIDYRNNRLRKAVWYNISLLYRMTVAILEHTGVSYGFLQNLNNLRNKLNTTEMAYGEDYGCLQQVKSTYDTGKQMVRCYSDYFNADPRGFITSLWDRMAGFNISIDYDGQEYTLHIPQMSDMSMRSDHRHYLKFWFHAYAIRGGPWKQKYSNDIHFGSLTEEKNQQILPRRAHDDDMESSFPTFGRYKESSKLKIETSFTEKNYPYYRQPITSIMKFGLQQAGKLFLGL